MRGRYWLLPLQGRRERGLGFDLSPVPFPQGKGCLLAGMTPHWLGVHGGEGLTPSPLGEGWGEVLY